MQVSDGLFVSLLEGAPDAMLCVASDGRIVLVNAQAERMFGYPRSELIGRPVETLVPDAAKLAHAAHRAGYAADPKPRAMGAAKAFPCRRRDGSTFPAEISLSAGDTADGIWIMAAVRDVTETHQLLAFAHREAVQLRPLDLNEVIKDIEQLLDATLGEHVVLTTDLAPDLCSVLADARQIGQVLVNLAVNARDAMPSGGTLTVTTAAADIDAGRQGLLAGRYACVTVSDTGVGMTGDVIDHAFEPFFTTKPKGEGTGLGLATVYGIITQARGQVRICSEPGLGTTFTILLPAAGRDVVPERPPAKFPGGGAGETILVVEDEPAMREVTRRILCRNGYKVVTACNGREAVEIAADRDADIDVLLTDMIMPQMLGKEAAERIRALRPGVKVLFMSGYTRGLLDSRGIMAADIHLVEKPFTEKSLLAKLRHVIADGETLPLPARRPAVRNAARPERCRPAPAPAPAPQGNDGPSWSL